MSAPLTLCMFAKAPVSGQVKTRLSRAIGPSAATRVARALILDTLGWLHTLPQARPIWATTDVPLAHDLAPHVSCWEQGPGDLSRRLEHVLLRALQQAPRAIALGADAPDLPNAYVEEASVRLNSHDAVLGPTDDGGFYAVGLTRMVPGLFENIPWSTAKTFEHTLARLRACGFRVHILPPWHDVDHYDDLQRLCDTADSHERTIHTRAVNDTLPRVSLITPVRNERSRLQEWLACTRSLEGLNECIAVDGQSHDGSWEVLAGEPWIQTLQTAPGRGTQLNAGAQQARCDVLWFVHADVLPPADALGWVREVMGDVHSIAGAFRIRTQTENRGWPLGSLLRIADVRPRWTRQPYGDQGLFLRRELFLELGGFRPWPVMEDLEFSQRLARRGSIRVVPRALRVSGRRFRRAPLKTILHMNTFPLLWRLGVSPQRLARWYGEVRD